VKPILLALAMIAAASASCSSGICGTHSDCSSCATDPFCLWCPDSNSCEHLSSGCSNHVLSSSACGASGGRDGGGCSIPCGSQCCSAGQTCSNGTCGYATAQLYFYICPNFDSGCSTSAFSVNGSCVPFGPHTPGTCYATGHFVNPGTTYSEAACASCPNNCGAAISTTTPQVFTKPTYFGAYWYCQTACTPPATCP
jgi:hypothetical protein